MELAICTLATMLTATMIFVGYLWTQLVELRTRNERADNEVKWITSTLHLLSSVDKTLAEQDVRLLQLIKMVSAATEQGRLEGFEVN